VGKKTFWKVGLPIFHGYNKKVTENGNLFSMSIRSAFKKENGILIGMIHLSPLLSMRGFKGMKVMLREALADLRALERAGFDGALIENDHDRPHTEFANTAQIASFTAVAEAVIAEARIPVGVQMMLNDWKSSFAIAQATGARFTRLDVFVDHVTSEWGELNPNPKEIMSEKKKLCPDLLLFTDVQVKYKTMVRTRPLTTSAKLALANGADGLVITGNATGEETPTKKIEMIRRAFPSAKIFVGAGVNEKNVREQLALANGAIVGTSIKKGRRISLASAKKLKKALKDTRV